MPGPLPKKAELRQRRNKSSSRATLPAESAPIEERPPLPPTKGSDGEGWHFMAKRFWDDVWSSPMRWEFVGGDLPALYRLVSLVDKYWKTFSLSIAKEIRLLEREFGLTPLARRRLEWQVAQTEEAKDQREMKRARRARVIDNDGDPREVLDG